MKTDWAAAARDAWALWRRDSAVLWPIAGLFLFLPALVLFVTVAPPPPLFTTGANEAEQQALRAAGEQWVSASARWFALSSLANLYGALLILVFYLDRRAQTLAQAMGRALLLFPRYGLAALLIFVPTVIGMLLIVPGLYLFGRFMLTGPAIVAEQPISAIMAVGRGLRLTKRDGLGFMGAGTAALVAWNVLPAPFSAFADALRTAGAGNPVVMILVLGLAAAIGAAVSLGFLLLRIALYRRLG